MHHPTRIINVPCLLTAVVISLAVSGAAELNGHASAKEPNAATNSVPTINSPVSVPATEVMSAEGRKPHPGPKPGEVLEMTCKELGNFEFDQQTGGPLPADIKQLNGVTIRLRGYMWPMEQGEPFHQFALTPKLVLRDPAHSCEIIPTLIQHTVVCNCPKDKPVGNDADEIVVEGKLNVEVKKDDGFIVSIFDLGVTSVKGARVPASEVMSAVGRRPHPVSNAGEVLEMTCKELGNFEFDQETGGPLPVDVKRLNGVTIRLRGYMWPMEQENPLHQFELIPKRVYKEHAYEIILPLIQQTIVCNCPKDKPVGYDPDEIVVEGKLNVEVKKQDGKIVSIFALDVTSVILPPVPSSEVMSAAGRKPHRAPRPGEVLEMTCKELGNFEFDQEKGRKIPADVMQLNGVTVRLRGYMLPMDQGDEVHQFAFMPKFVRWPKPCAWLIPPPLQHIVVCDCPRGKAVSYNPDELVVEGKLSVEVKKEDGYIMSVFGLDVTSMKPAPK